MSDKIFLENQFRKRKIPEGSGKHDDFILCQKLIQMQGKLSPQVYAEMLAIAREWVGV